MSHLKQIFRPKFEIWPEMTPLNLEVTRPNLPGRVMSDEHIDSKKSSENGHVCPWKFPKNSILQVDVLKILKNSRTRNENFDLFFDPKKPEWGRSKSPQPKRRSKSPHRSKFPHFSYSFTLRVFIQTLDEAFFYDVFAKKAQQVPPPQQVPHFAHFSYSNNSEFSEDRPIIAHNFDAQNLNSADF